MQSTPQTLPVPPTRIPPRDMAAEAAVLASCLVSSDAVVSALAMLDAESFYDTPPKIVFSAIASLAAARRPVDVVTVAGLLEQRGELAMVGGVEALDRLAGMTPDASRVEEYADLVRAKAKQRALIGVLQQSAADGFGDVGDADEWASRVSTAVAQVADDVASTDGSVSGEEAAQRLFDRWQKPDKSPPLRTGIPDLDRLMRGLRRKNLIVIGAHSGIGKSALATNIATNVLLTEQPEGQPAGVLIFSLEMGADEYMERMACSLARIDSRKLDEEYKGKFTPEEGRKLIAAIEALRTQRLQIVERGDITIAQIRAVARQHAVRMRRQGAPLRLVVIDYAQIVSPAKSGRRSENREQEVAAIGRDAKRLAKELDLPVLLLGQLNADAGKEGRKPRGSDMRESKGLLQDADKLILVWNPSAEERKHALANGERMKIDEDHLDEVDLILDKHRGGRVGTVRASYWPSYTLFGAYDGPITESEAPAPRPRQQRGSPRWAGKARPTPAAAAAERE